MIKTILFFSILSQVAFSNVGCKDTIIEFYSMIGIELKSEDFSSLNSFSEIGLTTEEFNNLETKEQRKYFNKLMPVKMKAKKTLGLLNYISNGLRENLMSIYLSDNAASYPAATIDLMMKRVKRLDEFEIRISACSLSDFSEAFKTSPIPHLELKIPVLQSSSSSM